jgi:hypothetical protein
MNKQINYYLFVPIGTLTAVFVSTMIYFIRQHNQWYRINADAELANKKFETDMLRASWLAEMFFEWDEQKKVAFPEQMISSFTKNLFESGNASCSATHPLEDIIKTSDKFSKIKLGKYGIELEQKENDIKEKK